MFSRNTQEKLNYAFNCEGHCQGQNCPLFVIETNKCSKKRFLDMICVICNEHTPIELREDNYEQEVENNG